MKYLCLLLLSIAGFNAYSQIAVLNADSARLGNPAGTGTVALHGTTLIKNIAEGNAADSVLVRGSDGAVKFVKRSSFGALGIPFSNGDNLPGSNYNGKFLFNTSLQKLRIYDSVAGIWKDAAPVDLSNYYTKASIDSLTTSYGTQLFNFVQDRALDTEVLHKTGNENKSGDLNIVGTFSVNGISYLNRLLQVSVPDAEAYLPVAHFYAPNNTVAGNTSQFRFGTAGTHNNAAEWRFMYNGDQSNANRMDFSFFGQGNPIMSYTAERRVGIGTTTPAYLFDVNGDARIKTQLLLGENAISHGNYPVDMRRNGIANSQGVFMATQNGYDIALRQNAGTDNFGIYTEQTNTDALTVTQSGNVGIGNLSPNEKLEVSGNIKAAGGVTGTAFNKVNITAPANGSTLTIADGASLITSGAFSNTLTTTGESNNTLPNGTNTLYSTKSASVTSAQLATTIDDETGTGNLVLSASPVFTGTPSAPTAPSGSNNNQLATTAYVQSAVAGLQGGSSALNFSNGLTNNSGSVSNNLSTGIAGGQELVGGTGANDALVIKGTTGNGTGTSLGVGINVGNNGSEKAFSVFNDGNIGLGTNNHVSGNFQIGADGSDGNLRYTRNGGASWFGIYDINNNTHYGFANALGAPIANFAGLGGWYKGIGIMANTESGNGYPVFGVNTADQLYGHNGVGGNMFGIKADKSVTTYHNVLDNGSGGVRIAGTIINDVLNGNQALQTNGNKEIISIANTGTGNNVLSDSPNFTGTPSAPTPPAGSNNNILANTAYVHTAVDNAIAIVPVPNLNQVLSSGNTSGQTAIFGTLSVGGSPVSGYTTNSISSGTNNYNLVSSSQGIGEYGILDNSFYLSAETVSDGIKFFGNANAFGLKVTNANAINIPNLTASQSVQTNANKELISVANTGTGDNVLATSPNLVTPVLGVASATSVNKITLTVPANTATLTLANNSSLITSGAFSNTLTTTAASNNTLPSGTNTLYSTKSASVTSAQLATTLTDKTGTGTVVFSASPALTGTPTAPTAAAGTNTTQLATTAYVQATFATLSINTQTANYTLVLADAGRFVQQNVSSANSITVPTNASVAFPIGTQIRLRQMGTGQIAIAGASGVTLQSADNALKSRVQFANITLIKVDTNTWAVMGDLTN